MNEDKTLAIIETNSRGALTPRNFEGVYRLSQIMAASGMMPKGMEKTETVFVAIQFGMEVGLSPMAAVQNLAVVNGRPCLWGDALLGLVRGSGLLVGIIETTTGEGDATTAVCTVTRRDDPGETVGKFSVADAKRAGLWGKAGPWTNYPRRMLTMRARGFALRDKFPDVLKGLYAREEIEPEQYMGQVEVLSSAATLRQIQGASSEPQEPSKAQSSATTQPARREPAIEPQGLDSADWPKVYRGANYDARGISWDGTVHTGAKTCNSDGTWRRRKGVLPETLAAAEARYPRIDPLKVFGPGLEADPLELETGTGPSFADVVRWIETAQTPEELDEAMDAGKDVDMRAEQRVEIIQAAATQAAIIERMQQT